MCDTSHMTDRSRLVLAIANQRARNLSSKSISPEHLLFALAAEGNSVASAVLRCLCPENEEIQHAFSAGRIATIGDKTARLPWDNSANQLVAHSAAEASRLEHNYIAPEHMILALSDVAPDVFERIGVKPDEVRIEVYSILGHEI